MAPSTSSRPGGTVPADTAQVYVPKPPVASMVASKGTLTSPCARPETKGSLAVAVSGSRTAIPSAFVSARASPLTFAYTWNVYSPAVVGVPEMRPVEASRARLGGSVPELIDHVFASDTLAVICSEYGVPVVATGADSGPSVSFGSPGLIWILKVSSEAGLPHPG